jgi:predicted nucleotidyltransferase component of viral defense system
MIRIDQIKNFYPEGLRENTSFQKHILREYLQLLILDFLASTLYTRKITFIGGTNLRLVKGLDRFSEDLDFDCKMLSKEEFIAMTDAVLRFLQLNGYHAEIRDRDNNRLIAYRRNYYFPELLFDLGLTGHKDQRFLMKVESQDQQILYNRIMVNIRGCGFFFPFPVPLDETLCSMKLSALISRQKGRDFYDAMFLLAQSGPDYAFLKARLGIHNMEELKIAIGEVLQKTNLQMKMKDFEHMLFHQKNSERILSFGEFIKTVLV